jgi:hypothetical protein
LQATTWELAIVMLVFFSFYFVCFVFVIVPPLWKLIFGSFVLSHVATSSHSSTIVEIAKVTPLENKLERN